MLAPRLELVRTVTKTDLADVPLRVRDGGFPGHSREQVPRVGPHLKRRVRVAAGERREHDLPLELRQGDNEP
jgi:hypothetical protein